MKQLRHAWTHRILVAAAFTAGCAAYGQQAADPYSGVSQPPPDDTIVASPEAQPPAPQAAKPSPATTMAAPPPAPAYTAPPSASTAAAPAPAAAANRPWNPDDDIVSSVPGQPSPQSADTTTDSTRLQTRNPDTDIVNVVPSPANELPEGTNIRVRLTEQLSTNETTAGSPFHGEVTTAVYKDGRVIIPSGSVLKGRVISVRQGHHLTGAATLHLRPDMVILPDGTAYHLYAQLIHSQARGTRTDSEGGVQPSSHWKKDTAEYGVGAGTGALVGARLAGPTGALVGATIGAGIITTHLLLQHPSAAVLPVGSIVTFSLSESMELTPTRN